MQSIEVLETSFLVMVLCRLPLLWQNRSVVLGIDMKCLMSYDVVVPLFTALVLSFVLERKVLGGSCVTAVSSCKMG